VANLAKLGNIMLKCEEGTLNDNLNILSKKGKLIVIDGIDGSGKATQSELLCNYCKKSSKIYKKISFPTYNDHSSFFVKSYLNGSFGEDPKAINPYAAANFYAIDRFISFQQSWKQDYLAGKYIICDRYTTSNLIHQMPKLNKCKWDDFFYWCYDYEYTKLQLPKPDIVIYLRVSTNVSKHRIYCRNDNKVVDIHEKDIDYLNLSYLGGDYAAKKDSWYVIDCSKNKNKEVIFSEILILLKNILK
jgi:dTMP kinase